MTTTPIFFLSYLKPICPTFFFKRFFLIFTFEKNLKFCSENWLHLFSSLWPDPELELELELEDPVLTLLEDGLLPPPPKRFRSPAKNWAFTAPKLNKTKINKTSFILSDLVWTCCFRLLTLSGWKYRLTFAKHWELLSKNHVVTLEFDKTREVTSKCAVGNFQLIEW